MTAPVAVRAAPARRTVREASAAQVFNALAAGCPRPRVLVRALALLEKNPLLSAGAFPGDLLRRLMDVPGSTWARNPLLYHRYQTIVRAAALARLRAPRVAQRAFWGELPDRLS
jgi:hypothetical protein